MFTSIVQFGVSAAIVMIAGGYLTRASDALGDRLRLGRSLAGMVLLAGATSLPELATGGSAALMGAVNLSAGDLLGSSLMNLLLLALLDMTHYARGRMFSREASANALVAGASIVLTALVLLLILLRIEWSLFNWVSIGSAALLITYGLLLRLIFLQQRVVRAETGQSEVLEESGRSTRHLVLVYAVAAAAILAAVPFLTDAAKQLAEQTGLGQSFIGTTLVALTTSLPEMVTTLTAVRLRAFDLAVGNIFGSNVLNMVIFAPVDMLQAGPLFPLLSATHAITAAWVILITMVAVLGLLYQAERRYWFLEPDATLVIVLILTALTTMYFWS